MGSSLFEQNLSGSAFRRGLPLPREIRLTGIILSSSLSLFLSSWVKNGPVNCHDGLTSPEDCEQANKVTPASLLFAAATKSALAVEAALDARELLLRLAIRSRHRQPAARTHIRPVFACCRRLCALPYGESATATPSTESEHGSPRFAPSSSQNFSTWRVKIITSRGCQIISTGSSGCCENSVSSSGSAIPPRSRPASQEEKARGCGCPTPAQAVGRSRSAANAVGSAFDVGFSLDRWQSTSERVVAWLRGTEESSAGEQRLAPHRWPYASTHTGYAGYLRGLTPRVRSV